MEIKFTMKSIYFILGCFVTVLSLVSCSEANNEYYDYKLTENKFNGSVLNYLESNRVEYDSILKVIDLVPGLKDTLALDGITVFAVDNESFRTVMVALNQIRKNNEQEIIPSINDLNIAELDTLVSRYVFKGIYDSELVRKNTGGLLLKSVKFDYPMQVENTKGDASGYINSGGQRLIFSNPKGSLLRSKWINTYTSLTDVKVNNGVVHKLVPNHSFGFDEFVFRLNK